MSTIGYLRNETIDGRDCLRGHINTLTLDFSVRLVPTGEPESSPRPSHRIYAEKSNDELAEVGAAWTKQMKNGAPQRSSFLSLNLDDPSFEKPINIAAFPAKTAGQYEVSWRRRQDREAGNSHK